MEGALLKSVMAYSPILFSRLSPEPSLVVWKRLVCFDGLACLVLWVEVCAVFRLLPFGSESPPDLRWALNLPLVLRSLNSQLDDAQEINYENDDIPTYTIDLFCVKVFGSVYIWIPLLVELCVSTPPPTTGTSNTCDEVRCRIKV